MADEQISIPSIVVLVVLGGLAIRYLFFSTSSPAQQSGSDAVAGLRRREAAVQQLQQMFPQIDRRTLLWDLQRTGGNMTATTERALAGQLQTPPQSFQPPPGPESRTGTPAAGHSTPRAGGAASSAEGKPSTPDLITRYNLQDKLGKASEPEVQSGGTGKKGQAWSANKDERQSLLQKRRDAMILEARRKMEAKLAAEREKSSSS